MYKTYATFFLALITSSQIIIPNHILHHQDYYADQDVPVQPLDNLHSFVKNVCTKTYPFLAQWTLSNIKQQQNNQTHETLYLYTFLLTLPNSSIVANMSSIPVSQVETVFNVYQGNQIVATYNLPNTTTSLPKRDQTIVGAYSQVNYSNLTDIQKNALNFIYQQIPEALDWTIIGAKTQIVAGQNNCFTFQYNETSKTICVYSRPWENNYMQLTLDDGTTVTSGGNNLTSESDHISTTIPDSNTNNTSDAVTSETNGDYSTGLIIPQDEDIAHKLNQVGTDD